VTTVILALAYLVKHSTVIVAVPECTPVTTPDDVTVATDGLSLRYDVADALWQLFEAEVVAPMRIDDASRLIVTGCPQQESEIDESR